MKRFYSLTTFAVALTLFSQTASAQAGGTYTAKFAGRWTNNGATPIWLTSAPPAVCNNCAIIIDAPGNVILNTSVTLTNGSTLTINSGSTLIIADSGAANFQAGNNIIMDGTGATNTIRLADNTSFLNASGASGYNGVLISQPNGSDKNYLKYYGTSPVYFSTANGNLNGNAIYGTTQLGGAILNSTGTLPIVLTGFSAVLNNGEVDLSWSSQLEINADHYSVERSTDAGAHWSVIGTVAAHGNSSTILNYSFTDSKPATGTSQYRLQLVDLDAKYAYSEVKSVRNGLVTSVSVYPNPAHDYVNVTLAAAASNGTVVRLMNQSGQLLQEKSVTGAAGSTIALSVSSYPQGNYLVVVVGADGSKQVSKLMITK